MKLSIITINRNNAEGLLKTIESVVSQTYTDFEYIVIDGASTDSSIEVIKRFESIKYNLVWVSEPDSGIYNAMNKGILKATGEYLLFLNSGDWLYNSTIISEVFTSNFDEDIVYGDVMIIGQNGYKHFNKYPDIEYVDMTFLTLTSLPHGASFMRSSLFQKYGLYSEKYQFVSDWEFFIVVICRYNCSLRKIDKIIINYDNDGISSLHELRIIRNAEVKQVLEEQFPRIGIAHSELRKYKRNMDYLRGKFIFKLLFKFYKDNKFN